MLCQIVLDILVTNLNYMEILEIDINQLFLPIYAYNATGFGRLSPGVNDSTQIPNNPVIQLPIGNKAIFTDQLLVFTINTTDLDNDNMTYGTNASKGSLDNMI